MGKKHGYFKTHHGKKRCKLSDHEKISGILEARLREIYGARMVNLELISTMQYPMKGHLFVVRYNVDLENELPIKRAQIVVDITTEELKKFEPSLL